MYCSSCGSAVTTGLTYCNRCGAEVGAKGRRANRPPDLPPEYLIWAILGVSVGGLGVILALMAVMKQVLHFSTELIAGFLLLSFLLLVAAESVFIWMLARPLRRLKEVADTQRLNVQENEGVEIRTRVLADAAPTVTEHTTRTLSPASRKVDSE